MPKLIDSLEKVVIVAYREDTQQLEDFFRQESLICEVNRQQDTPAAQHYAAIHRCMLNHAEVWKKAATYRKPTLIVEADFVPVRHLGTLPLPFDADQTNVGMAWVYTCAPQLYSVSPEGFLEGFSTALVAYIVTPQGAQALCDFVPEITAKHGTGYYNFDSDIDKFLRQRGFKNYIPFRNYGEHGGKSNPEHRRNGMSGIHRADVLYHPLAFLPIYATADRSHPLDRAWTFFTARLQARIKGLGRLLLGKFLRPKVVRLSRTPLRLLRSALLRQLTPHL